VTKKQRPSWWRLAGLAAVVTLLTAGLLPAAINLTTGIVDTDYLKRNAVWVVGGTLIILLIVIAFVVGAVPRPTPTGKMLEQLVVGVHRSHFEGFLGLPQIDRPISEDATAYRGRNLLWFADSYAVQAIVNEQDTVQAYSVTTRSDTFHPDIPPEAGAGKLGRTMLASVRPGQQPVPLSFHHGIGPENWYSEYYPPSAASHFKTLVLTAGVPGISSVGSLGQ